MKNQDFTINFDSAYMERLTSGAVVNSRSLALEEQADQYMFNLISQAASIPKMNGAEPHPFNSLFFDPNATYRILNSSGNTYEEVPALSVLYSRPVTQETMQAYLLGRKWATIPNDLTSAIGETVRNPNGNGGRFAPPIWLSAKHKGWNIFALLANPEIDPNPDLTRLVYTGFDVTPSQTDNTKRQTWMKTDNSSDNHSPLELLTSCLEADFHDEDPKTGRYAQLLHDHYIRAISGLIDAGAELTPLSEDRMENEPELVSRIQDLTGRCNALIAGQATDMCLQDLKHMYALGEFNEMLTHAAQSVPLASQILALRDDMPKWMEDKFSVAFDLLAAGGIWGDRMAVRRAASNSSERNGRG